METTQVVEKKEWTPVGLGPRQAKQFKEALSAFGWEAKKFTEITDYGSHDFTLLMGGSWQPGASAKLEAIKEKYNAEVTPQNYRAIITDIEAAQATLKETRPVVDKRSTPEQLAERAAATALYESRKIHTPHPWNPELDALEPRQFQYYDSGNLRAGIKHTIQTDLGLETHDCYQFNTLQDLTDEAAGLMMRDDVQTVELVTHTGEYQNMKVVFKWARPVAVGNLGNSHVGNSHDSHVPTEGITVTENKALNGVELRFPSKAAAQPHIAALKARKWRWSPSGKCLVPQTQRRRAGVRAFAGGRHRCAFLRR